MRVNRRCEGSFIFASIFFLEGIHSTDALLEDGSQFFLLMELAYWVCSFMLFELFKKKVLFAKDNNTFIISDRNL